MPLPCFNPVEVLIAPLRAQAPVEFAVSQTVSSLRRYCRHKPETRVYRTAQDDQAEGRTERPMPTVTIS